ncbi:gastrula zinc finger protein XlCGF8.2DB [Folsomia candida]|uniref:gastrula zinc finger protein XlCGF8.2DB n=1 Tax=Folsomia candida TaxID=158441 RepID=UPI000B906A8A|nr:gastrula zinc finger protein XlCGF8.2DB [Folsomia candida]
MLPLNGMQVSQKMSKGQKSLVPTTQKGDRFQKKGQLPPQKTNSVQVACANNHEQSPSANSRSSNAKKLPQLIGNKKIFPCKICLRPFTCKTSAAHHARTHFNPHELERTSLFHEKCPHCAKVFFMRHHLTDHLFVHMSGEERAEVRQGWRHVCYFCTKRFQSPSDLSRHLLTHTKEKIGGRCPTCRKTFSSKETLTQHRFLHLSQDEKVALVEQRVSRVSLFCHKIFPNNRTYHEHLVTHTKEKPFPCDQCVEQVSLKSNLNKHARIHSADPRPFKCTECDQALTTKDSLVVHKKTVHRNVKDFACHQCGNKFGTKSHMVRHLSSIHAKIRLPCPHCGHTFTQKSSLVRLRKLHPSE